jgi:CHAP domain
MSPDMFSWPKHATSHHGRPREEIGHYKEPALGQRRDARGPMGHEKYQALQVAPRRSPRPLRTLRRLALILGAGALLIALVATPHTMLGKSDSFLLPSDAALFGLSVPQRIVAIADSQVGYRTEPSNSYCNKYSAYWHAGTANCPSGELAEEWCADFAAWAWAEAEVSFTYGYAPAEINGGAVTFYEWGVAHGTWHPVTSGYPASPGDVAVYGLSLEGGPSAAHVAIVTNDGPGPQGPDVVNGDGDRTGFSVVETGTDQLQVHIGQGYSALAGYVSPP